MATERTYSNLLMWRDDRLLEGVNGKCVEELMGTVLVLLVEAAVGMLCHGCPHRSPDWPVSPFPPSSPPVSDFALLLPYLRICKMSLHFQESVACGKTTGCLNTRD